MKVEPSILKDRIDEILIELNQNGQIKRLLDSNLLDEYMNGSLLTKTLNQNLPLNNRSISELYHISRLINTLQPKIKVDEYFTDDEITQAINNKNNIKIESNPLIKLKDVLYSKNNNEETWMTMVTYKEINEWMKTGKLGYNMETQRVGKMRKIGHKMFVVPHINDNSVEDIKDALVKNEFYSNMISFNITPDYNKKLEYNPVEKTLTIDTAIFDVDVIDGYHRCSGIVKAFEVDSNLEGELYLKVTNMSIEKAQKFIRQESKSNIQNQDALEKYNPKNKITRFVKNINEMGSEESNALYRKIDMGVNTRNTWIMFETFKEGLDLSGFLREINYTDDRTKLKNMEIFIVTFFDNFYKIANDYKLNDKKREELTDPTFIKGLIVTCYKFYKSGKGIDINLISAMEVFIKKFKTTTTKYTYEKTLKTKEETKYINKFKRLLEVEN